MYQYDPQSNKKREKGIVLGLALTAVAAFGFAKVQGVPFPALLQLIGVFALTSLVIVLTRYLMRRYVYSVEAKENGAEGDSPDLIITEYYGNHVSVVCRISTSEIESVTPITRENRGELSELLKRKRVYTYTGEIEPAGYCLLTVHSEEETFYLKIASDEALINAIKNA